MGTGASYISSKVDGINFFLPSVFNGEANRFFTAMQTVNWILMYITARLSLLARVFARVPTPIHVFIPNKLAVCFRLMHSMIPLYFAKAVYR